jgi:hypothetical protein
MRFEDHPAPQSLTFSLLGERWQCDDCGQSAAVIVDVDHREDCGIHHPRAAAPASPVGTAKGALSAWDALVEAKLVLPTAVIRDALLRDAAAAGREALLVEAAVERAAARAAEFPELRGLSNVMTRKRLRFWIESGAESIAIQLAELDARDEKDGEG